MVVQIRNEVNDRFGSLPQPVINLFNLVELKMIGSVLNFRLIKVKDHTLSSYFSNDIASSTDRELIRNKLCLIMDKAKESFYFIQEGKESFGLRVDIPVSEKDPIEYSKKFLQSLI
jgi:transcription-repair coupling factor (superfamily II helicase)